MQQGGDSTLASGGYLMLKKTVEYDWDTPLLCLLYTKIIQQFFLADSLCRWNCNYDTELACTDHYQGAGQDIIQHKANYTRKLYVIRIQITFHHQQTFGPPSAAGCFRPWLSANRFCFCDWKSSNSRLGPANLKVPQPGVDLKYMAALAWCRALTIGTPEFEGLLLLSIVLVRNGSEMLASRKQGKSLLPCRQRKHRDWRGLSNSIIQLESSRHTKALPATVLSLLWLATVYTRHKLLK